MILIEDLSNIEMVMLTQQNELEVGSWYDLFRVTVLRKLES